ncbi:MAG: CPBP family intramembrane metalloprotease [Lachnospiraceae bacterium]|nr:CPBP family intramembrane metalloprotease [Lachnospiraceae bacterium]
MNAKQVNRYFLTTIILQILSVAILVVFPFINEYDWRLTSLWDEAALVVPAIFFLIVSGERRSSALGLKRIRFTSALMSILFMLMTLPLCNAAGGFSQIFTDNIVVEASAYMAGTSFPSLFFLIAVWSPLCEEIAFRGFVFRGYRGNAGFWRAAIVSAFLFGLVHLNMNQFIYAFVFGILLALLTEATGSIWPGFFYHMLFNAIAVFAMYGDPSFAEGKAPLVQSDTEMILYYTGAQFALGVIFLIPAACILVWIFKNEGRRELIDGLLGFDMRGRIVTPSLVIGVALCLVIMGFFAVVRIADKL